MAADIAQRKSSSIKRYASAFASDVAQRESSSIKLYASAFSNI